MRITTSLVAAMISAVSVAGCGGGEPPEAAPSASAAPSTQAAPVTPEISPLSRKACAALAEADRLRADPDTEPGAANIAQDRAILQARADRVPELRTLVGQPDDNMDLSEAADRLREWCSTHT